MVSFDVFVVKAFWGNMLFDFATSSARGQSGGILCVWDNLLFHKKRTYATDHCLCVEGTWLANNTDLLFISVYSPQELSLKRALWTYMAGIINCWHGEVIIMGDFNEVRYPSERYGSSFHSLNAAEFNRFIANSHLIDIPAGWSNLYTAVIVDSWNNDGVVATNSMTLLKNKLKCLKTKGLKDLEYVKRKINGEWIDNPIRVKSEFYNYFSDIVSAPESNCALFEGIFPKRLDYEQSCELEEVVSNDEIKRAIWNCGSDKSPGPDGFTFEFFKKYWFVVGSDVIKAVKEFFNSSSFPKGCNSSFTALIPKVLGANKLIQEQSTFIKGRQIMDGSLVLNELISWCKAKKEQCLLLKVDFQKAFDSVRWDHLDEILGKFGFGNK
ncbi:RNA-directed DNA polymerase, eukaryota, reverse transcriptase zinc-binding domain protein [Tanacetum coccineum]